MNFGRPLLLVAALFASSSCDEPAPAPNSFTIFAAASLTPVIEELVRAQDLASTARLHTASTSTLARQLESGAEADLILTAHPEWIAWLSERDLLEPNSIRDIASNALVWVVPKGSANTAPFDLAEGAAFDLAEDAHLAIGDPAHVPLGRYTREALVTLGAWSALEPKTAPTLDARSALRLVELRQAEAGIVFASDAASSTRVTIRARFPRDLHAPIRYQAAALRGASPAARAFLDTLSSPAVSATFHSFGFLPPAP